MKSNRVLKFIFILSILVIVFLVSAKSEGWINTSSVKKVTTEKAQRRTIIQTISGNGKVRPATELKISSGISGEITALYVKLGDKVKKGDLLLRLKPGAYQSVRQRASSDVNVAHAAHAEAQARLAQAKAKFINAQSDLKRKESLYNDKVIPAAEFEETKTAFEVAKEEVNAAEATVRTASHNVQEAKAILNETNKNLDRSAIYAPVDGIVSQVHVREGEKVLGALLMEGTELLSIADPSRMEVVLEVNESDIINISTGDTAEIELSAYPGTKFKGLVNTVSNTAKVNRMSAEQLTNFEVRIAFLQDATTPGASIRSGMTATVNVKCLYAHNTLCISKKAVTMKDEMDNAVFVIEKGVAKLRALETGIEDKEFVQVLSGLRDKEKIITGPVVLLSKLLKEGDRVEEIQKSIQ